MVFADSVFDTFIIPSCSIALAFETFAVCSQAAAARTFTSGSLLLQAVDERPRLQTRAA